jgi:hypothetical protein
VRSGYIEVRESILIFQVFFCSRVTPGTIFFYFDRVENGNFRAGNNYQRAYFEDNRVDVRDAKYNFLNDGLQKIPLKHPCH